MGSQRQLQLLRMAVAFSFLLLLANHLLPPKAFAATQLLFDYSAGFIRRGLTGEAIMRLLGPTITGREIVMSCAVITFTGLVGFYLFLRRGVVESRATLLILILALNSFAMASFTGSTGYLDALLLLAAVMALSSDAGTGAGLAARILLVMVSVLIHENMLPYFALLVGFDLFLARQHQTMPLIPASLPLAGGAVMVVLVVLNGQFSADEAAAFAEYVQGKAMFGVDNTSLEVLNRTVSDNLALMSDLHSTRKYWAWIIYDGVPLAAMAGWLFWVGGRMLDQDDGALPRLLLGLAILAPLSLNLIAFDVVRFGAASVIVGFLALAVILRHVPGAEARLSDTLTWPHFIVVLVLNVNIFTSDINDVVSHETQFPWVLLSQLKWLSY